MSDFWQEFREPEANENDWHRELLNQWGHTFLGVMLAAVMCCIWFAVSGEMPYRAPLFAVIVLGYLAWEGIVQGWKAGDSWFDALMANFGAGGLLLPLREISVSGWIVHLQFDPILFLVIAVVWGALLFLRVKKRYDAR